MLQLCNLVMDDPTLFIIANRNILADILLIENIPKLVVTIGSLAIKTYDLVDITAR